MKTVFDKPSRLNLADFCQRELMEMNNFVREGFINGTIDRNTIFPNGVRCGDYCMAQLLRQLDNNKAKCERYKKRKEETK